jgi:hypothetical protein
MSRNKLIVAAALAALTLTAGCSSDSEAPAGNSAEAAKKAPVTVQIGQPLTVEPAGSTATFTLSKPAIREDAQNGIKPENGAFLVAFVKVEVAKGKVTCPCDLPLVQADGTARERAFGSFDDLTPFEPTEVVAGKPVEGWVVWDLPKDKIDGAKVQLKIGPQSAPQEFGSWTVKL